MNPRTLLVTFSLLLTLWASSALFPAPNGLPVQLSLKAEATVWGDRILLRDIIESEESLSIEQASLTVGASPRPGSSELFSREEIRQKLLANRVVVGDITGSRQVRVHRVSNEVNPVQFLPEIKAFITERIPQGERISLEMLSSQAIAIPGPLNWRIHPAQGQDLVGTILFSLEGIDPRREHVVLTRLLNVRIQREGQVAVSNRSLRSGEEIGAADVRYEWRTLSPGTVHAFTADNPPVGRQTDRNLPVNQVITPGYIRQEYLVQRGATATLVARASGVTASTPVKVLENGILNQWVLIQNPRSSKNIRARVSGKNQLEVLIQ
jgi:flagella basal body P-ring formation protein FlgA